MICPSCGRATNSRSCEGCGTLLRKNSEWVGWLSVILSIIIVVCAVLIFVLPFGPSDITSAAQTYVAAAYYANKLVNDAASYPSMDNYKADLEIAIDACHALQSGGTPLRAEINFSLIPIAYAAGALEGLDTDVDYGYAGGYTAGAQESVDAMMSSMQKDAANALQTLETLDQAIGNHSNSTKMVPAIEDAKKELAKADRTSIIVGSTKVSFAGITILGPIHSAFIGVDVVIDGKTMYLGANGSVMLSGSSIGDKVTVIDTQSGNGVVMDAQNIADALQLGRMIALHFNDLDQPPISEVFTDTKQFTYYLSDEISRGLGFNSLAAAAASATPNGNPAATSNTFTSGNGVYIDLPDLIGNWVISDVVFSPWATIDSKDSVLQMQLEIEKKQLKTVIGDKVGIPHLIFRSDGTGIYYIDVDSTTFTPTQFWWRVDDTGAILFVSGMASYDYDKWDDYRIAVMRRFQDGDYSDFIDEPNLSVFQFYGSDLYEHADLSICNVYVKTSDSVAFEYIPTSLAK